MANGKILCVKDYRDGQGETLLEAGKTYGFKIRTGTVPMRGRHYWKYPLTVFTPHGSINIAQDTADEVLRRGCIREDLFLLYLNTGVLEFDIPDGRTDGDTVTYRFTLGGRELPVTASPCVPGQDPLGTVENRDRVCCLLGSGLMEQPADAGDAVRIWKMLETLFETESMRDPESPFLEGLMEELQAAEKNAARIKMEENGIRMDDVIRSVYREYLEHDMLPESFHQTEEQEEDAER